MTYPSKNDITITRSNFDELRNQRDAAQDALTFVQAQLEAVTAERDEARAQVGELVTLLLRIKRNWRGVKGDPVGTMIDTKLDTLKDVVASQSKLSKAIEIAHELQAISMDDTLGFGYCGGWALIAELKKVLLNGE